MPSTRDNLEGAFAYPPPRSAAFARPAQTVEQRGVFETSLPGPATGNLYLDVHFPADFRIGHRSVPVEGFLRWRRHLSRTLHARRGGRVRPELEGRTGRFHGVTRKSRQPVMARNTFHFGYADGSPYFEFGTTAYGWIHQNDQLEYQTLETLRNAPFHKLRMCVLPKHYAFNANEPQYYPFPATRPVSTITRGSTQSSSAISNNAPPPWAAS